MPLYDAVVHTFTTVATGGFSPKTASIGFYDSVGVEAAILLFNVAPGGSFSVQYLLYNRRRFEGFVERELLSYLGILPGRGSFCGAC